MIDLHLHLDGSLTPEEILQLANCAKVSLPCDDAEALRPALQAAPACRNLGEYLEKFELPLQVLQTEEAICLGVYFLLKRLSGDGLIYAEIRFAPQLHLSRGLTQRQVVAAAAQGLQRGIAEFGMPAQLILCCMRSDTNKAENLETIRVAKKFLGKGVCAVDLAGNEAAYPTKDFADVFGLAKEFGVPFIIHAGEAAGADSVRQALKLGACRIGHGIRAAEDETILAQLKQTPLELCFTSNLQTKAVASDEEYPINLFLKQGIPVTINTDNMTVSGTSLRKEYLLLQNHLTLSTDTLCQIACNAADAAFVTPQQKEIFRQQIATHFTHWIKKGVLCYEKGIRADFTNRL